MLIPEHTLPESTRWHRTETRPCHNRVPAFRYMNSISNTDPEPDYETSKETSHTVYLNPPSFEDIFGEDPELQHSAHSRSSSYHPELH
ncbi:hypothetical protein PVK06_012459 [Gossypium arboreum]|uniref:Uncharacterized protein n=1 Tax=Gossypium arboreum TaxID=29729 RepID=A0ABR0QCI7_GOSAR|nr:hypothetical protein PVK06_012459 [Gossypium arboreum]